MKRLFILGILAFLAGCVGGASVGKPNCSRGGEVCVTIEVAEPIRWGEPIIVTIKVIAKRDISDLRVSLNHWPGVVVEGPEGWEVEVREKKVAEFAASWKTDVKADKPSVFVRKVRLPLAEREFRLSAAVYRPDLGYISSGVSVLLTRKGGKVYYSGTPVPTPISKCCIRITGPEGATCEPGPCLTIRVVEPVRWGEPVRVLLHIEGKRKDIPPSSPMGLIEPTLVARYQQRDLLDLGLTFAASDSSVKITPERGEFRELMRWPAGNGVWWVADVLAESRKEYTFLVQFPLKEGAYQLHAKAYDLVLGPLSSDFVEVHWSRGGGKVFAPSLGTPLPTATPWPTPPPTPTYPPPRRPVTPTPTPPVSPFLSPLSPLPAPTLAASP